MWMMGYKAIKSRMGCVLWTIKQWNQGFHAHDISFVKAAGNPYRSTALVCDVAPQRYFSSTSQGGEQWVPLSRRIRFLVWVADAAGAGKPPAPLPAQATRLPYGAAVRAPETRCAVDDGPGAASGGYHATPLGGAATAPSRAFGMYMFRTKLHSFAPPPPR